MKPTPDRTPHPSSLELGFFATIPNVPAAFQPASVCDTDGLQGTNQTALGVLERNGTVNFPA